ncbi:hypothetical protein HYS00_01895 [Candidatus Microgenomates bacterium]|nr:hypothetical protein [Candidatus Microgenomates bacterium]
MQWHQIVGILAGIISLVSGIPYVRDILKGTTKPNAVSWGGWFLLTLIATFAQFSSGASWSVILIITETIKVGIIFLLALKYGVQEYTKLDWVCLALGLLAVVLWKLTNQPVLAIVLAVIADLIMAYPTFVKSFYEPYTETASAFVIAAVAALLSVVSTQIYDSANLIYPVYLILANTVLGTLIILGQKKPIHNKKK